MSHLHIPDGVLPTWLWVAGWMVTLIAVGVAGRLAERTDVRRKVPLLAIVSALMLVAMSSEVVPLAYHVNLTVIGGVLLGGPLSIIAAFIVEVVLAMLGHGGITVLGLNTVVIASEMLLGAALFRGLVTLLGRQRIRPAAFLATVLTLATTTLVVVGIVAFSGAGAAQRETGALDPATLSFSNPVADGVFSVGLFSGGEGRGDEGAGADAPSDEELAEEATLSVTRFAAVVFVLGPFGWALEALITAAVLGYVSRVRPGLLWGGANERAGLRPPGDEGVSR